ncbi:MAG: hypothetical protein KJ614_14860 [Gammaproteobacteria bacterium]|nr:hypothetical protein [Gammaproteobacteria bacterium]MBU3998316.1 hypothetical protein [Gammaproteobacteria bacterium]MBU4079112.1 hypothetical protein [Gammaproteobacteria bacterium]MBU4115366.1 hypothetical protein [Gammaproteobacteria bacterium]MBU4171962.1 hypothetical protein [Gammaproteobacteria bacterium]
MSTAAPKRWSALRRGERNGEAAPALLRDYGIPVVSESLFGIGHRQISFNVSNGDVWSHQVTPLGTEPGNKGYPA